MKRFFTATLTLTFAMAAFAPALAQKEANEINDRPQFVKIIPPRTVDFRAQLGSDNTALDEVGGMIDDGRTFANARTLLSAAMILFMEEETTGLEAQITGKEILREATKIALDQNNPDALAACATVWESEKMGDEPDTAKMLAAMVPGALKELVAKRQSVRGAGAKVADIRVENKTDKTIYLYIDGEYVGYANPGYYVVFSNIGIGFTTLFAQTDVYWEPEIGDYTYAYYEDRFDLQNYDLTENADFKWTIK